MNVVGVFDVAENMRGIERIVCMRTVLAMLGVLGVVGFVFGSERYGLSNDDVYRCHATLSIPTAPDYGSLNLAQAVQILAYEWRQALGGFGVQARTPEPAWADGQAVQGLLEHWQRALVAIGFLDPQAPKKLVPRLNQLANRARVTH